jgi:hypothetical protein
METTPVAAARVLTLVETDPSWSWHPSSTRSVTTAMQPGPGTPAAYSASNAESVGDRGVCGARIEAIHSENRSGGQPCSAADAMDWIETKAI